jgi:hypothetical protein
MAIEDASHRTPQVLGGGLMSIVLSVLFYIKPQRARWHPALVSIGWHVGLWTLSPRLGSRSAARSAPASQSSGAQSACSGEDACS